MFFNFLKTYFSYYLLTANPLNIQTRRITPKFFSAFFTPFETILHPKCMKMTGIG